MALVTITKNDSGVRRSFVSYGLAARSRPPGSPIAKITYQDVFTITAKGANDETQVNLNLLLPDNFYYRCLLYEWQASSTGVAALQPTTGMELAAAGTIIADSATPYRFPIVNVLNAAIGVNAFKIDDDAVTSDFSAYFSADLSKYFIIGLGTSVRSQWMDTSADATAAVFCNYRAEFLQYTLEQGIDFDTNTPALTFS